MIVDGYGIHNTITTTKKQQPEAVIQLSHHDPLSKPMARLSDNACLFALLNYLLGIERL